VDFSFESIFGAGVGNAEGWRSPVWGGSIEKVPGGSSRSGDLTIGSFNNYDVFRKKTWFCLVVVPVNESSIFS